MADNDPLTQDDLIELFGDSMPVEAMQLLWGSHSSTTIGEIRAKLRAMAPKYRRRQAVRMAIMGALRLRAKVEGDVVHDWEALGDDLTTVALKALDDLQPARLETEQPANIGDTVERYFDVKTAGGVHRVHATAVAYLVAAGRLHVELAMREGP